MTADLVPFPPIIENSKAEVARLATQHRTEDLSTRAGDIFTWIVTIVLYRSSDTQMVMPHQVSEGDITLAEHVLT